MVIAVALMLLAFKLGCEKHTDQPRRLLKDSMLSIGLSINRSCYTFVKFVIKR